MTTDDFTNITPIPEGSDIIEPPEIGHKAEACSPDEPAEDAAAKRPWRVTYLGAIIAVALLVALVSIIGAVSRTQGRANAARAHVVAGQSALVDGDRDSALYEFTEALRLDPRIPGANKALGQIALANGRADEAIRHYETELKINPNDRQSHIALGCLYSLGVIPPDDPHALRGYLLQRFTDIAPAEYSPNLTYTAPEGTDPLALSIYHYQFAAHGHPEDPSPAIGAALTHLADYDLAGARDKLNRLSVELAGNESVDEEQLIVVRHILDDINQEEMYIAALPAEAATPATPMPSAPVPLPDGTPLPTSTSSTPPPDLSGSLATLPPIAGAAGPERTSFGSRYPAPTTATQGSDLGLRVTANDILPQPTVKPISRDIHVNETSDYIKTIKLVNIFQQGEVGLPRVGETIVMPNTNADVKLVESSASKIVLEENGTQFVWVPGDVGWVLKEPVGTAAQQDQSGLDISANKPADQSGGSGQSNSSGGTMGPEVPSNR